jgi:hypothetical protein
MLPPSSSNRPSVFPKSQESCKAEHGGRGDSENLALACYHCNACKGRNLSGLDPESGALVRLFHPRQDRWDEHFERNGVLIVGSQCVGRATVGLLKMNAADRRRLRAG